MEMVDLILTVCLTANPDNCREEHLYFESRGSLVQCMMLAPSRDREMVAGTPDPQGRALAMHFSRQGAIDLMRALRPVDRPREGIS